MLNALNRLRIVPAPAPAPGKLAFELRHGDTDVVITPFRLSRDAQTGQWKDPAFPPAFVESLKAARQCPLQVAVRLTSEMLQRGIFPRD